MKKLWVVVTIALVIAIAIVLAVGVKFIVRRMFTGGWISKITEKVIERAAEKAMVVEEKMPTQKTEAPAEEVETALEETEYPTKQISTGKMNDDLWVEIYAYIGYKADKYDDELRKIKTTDGQFRVTEKYRKDIENIYKKLGVTEDEFAAYTGKLLENLEHYIKLEKRGKKRIEELVKAGK